MLIKIPCYSFYSIEYIIYITYYYTYGSAGSLVLICSSCIIGKYEDRAIFKLTS